MPNMLPTFYMYIIFINIITFFLAYSISKILHARDHYLTSDSLILCFLFVRFIVAVFLLNPRLSKNTLLYVFHSLHMQILN